MQKSVLADFSVDGIPCRQGNSVSMVEFRIDGGIPYQQGNSVSTEFRVNGILCRRNSVDTQLYILLKQ
jgi:hypothetical protein